MPSKNNFFLVFVLIISLIVILANFSTVKAVERTLCAHTECDGPTCILKDGLADDECVSNEDCGGKGGPSGWLEHPQKKFYQTGYTPAINISYLQQNIVWSDFLGPLVRRVLAATLDNIEIVLPSEKPVSEYEYIPHYECQNEKCVLVDSCGIDQCSTDSDCRLPRKMVCSNLRCVEIQDSGEDECQTDSDCGVKYSCNTENYTCYQDTNGSYDSIDDCNADCVSPETKYKCINKGTENWQCVEDANGEYDNLTDCENDCKPTPPPPPPPTPPLPSCSIMSFTINGKDNEDQNPLLVWVNQLLTGEWSANAGCVDCKIACSPEGCNWSGDNIGTDGKEQFKIPQPDLYTYTLTCWGENQDTDTDTLQLNVRAVNLPKWREIIPILPFLRGLWPFRR